MADKKISQLTGATTPLAGTEVLPIVQSGSTVKVSAADVTAGRAVSAGSLSVDGAAVINEAGGDADFRVEGDNNTHLLFCDASTDRVGIKKSAPDTVFNIGFVGADQITTVRLEGSNGSSERYALDIVADGENAFTRIKTGAGGGAPTDKITIDPSSNVTVSLGNLVVGTAAKGIDFSANTGAAGETSSLLNWYEEGTWTPTNSNAITVNSAKYTRIGRIVICTFDITAGGSGTTGDMGGLPFNPTNPTAGGVLSYHNENGTETWSVSLEASGAPNWSFRLGSTQKQLSANKIAKGMITYSL